MRLAYAICLTMLLCTTSLAAQKHDYTWLTGYQSQVGFSSNWNYWFGISRFDFTEDTVALSYDSLGINFDRANATISDKYGNLLFYTNGVTIRNRLDEVIENGDSLGIESYYLSTFAPSRLTYGQRFNNLALCLPVNNGDNGLYRYFYPLIDSFGGYFLKLLMATVDVNANNGHGLVTEKDVPVMIEKMGGQGYTATKHGNGRDWWLINRSFDVNCYNVTYSGETISCTYQQACGGAVIPDKTHGTMDMSQDGSWLVSASAAGDLNIFTFDRCNGNLSFYEQASVPTVEDSFIFPISIEFSPDSRYMYLFCSQRVFQYDMQAIPINSSKKVIAEWDGFADTFDISLFHGQLAPDGKIYVGPGSGTKWIGIINNPNLADTLCELRQHSIQLPSFISGLTYYPNYRLGAKTGGPCDTITSLNEIPADKLLQVYPNPTTDYLFADYGYLPWDKYKNEVTLQITDATGRVSYQQELPKYSGIQKLIVQAYPQGIYYLSIMHGHQTIATRKWVKGE